MLSALPDGTQVSAQQQQRSPEELEAELALTRTIIDNAADAIFHLDQEGRTTFANGAAERLFGWSLDELRGRKLHDIVHYKYPDGSPFPMCECPLGHVFTTGKTLSLHEDLFWDRDGAPVPVACSNAAIVRAGETKGSVLIVRDITQRVQAEEERKLLLNELNHRVKNMLSVVQSIGRQTFGSPAKDARVGDFDARLAALSSAHNLLVERTWLDPDLRELFEAALAPFGDLGHRIILSGPEVRIGPKSALAITLAAHELATNAAKYGALSNEAGVVTCEWRVAPVEVDRTLEIFWRETGGPPVRPPASAGFGTRMIERALAIELSGSAKLDFAEDGLRCTIIGRLPAAST